MADLVSLEELVGGVGVVRVVGLGEIRGEICRLGAMGDMVVRLGEISGEVCELGIMGDSVRL